MSSSSARGKRTAATPLAYLLSIVNDPGIVPAPRRDKAAIADCRIAIPWAEAVPKKVRAAAEARKAGGRGTEWAGDLDGEWPQ